MSWEPVHHAPPPPLRYAAAAPSSAAGPEGEPERRVTPGMVVAWVVILIIAIGLPVLGSMRMSAAKAAAGNLTKELQLDMQAKYAVQIAQWSPGQKAALMANVDKAKGADERSVIKAAVVAGEIEGSASAMGRLSGLAATEDVRAFEAVYRDGTKLPDGVAERYGFYARLADGFGKPDSDPERAEALRAAKILVVGMIVIGLGGLVVGFVSLALFVTAIVLICIGKVGFQVVRPFGPQERYAESFAFYLGSYLVFGIALELIWKDAPFAVHVLPLVAGVGLAIAWPVLRGATVPAVRIDWGVHTGRGVVLEMLCGIGGYLAGLPVVAVGIAIAGALAKMAHFDISHPIQSELTKQPLMIFVLAVVFAPITEELLFRGTLLSHLRAWMGPWLAAALTALIFAAIHPQGWPAIPALGSIGFMLALIRQWRGTLIASITAHALNNATVLLISLILLAE